ncbi:MAG: hypothetical protein QOE58_2885 [Actinomycetota bacterium]|jgi:hypothetical protein|nr:hypothetical protein [Actinomycetota bacterium]
MTSTQLVYEVLGGTGFAVFVAGAWRLLARRFNGGTDVRGKSRDPEPAPIVPRRA